MWRERRVTWASTEEKEEEPERKGKGRAEGCSWSSQVLAVVPPQASHDKDRDRDGRSGEGLETGAIKTDASSNSSVHVSKFISTHYSKEKMLSLQSFWRGIEVRAGTPRTKPIRGIVKHALTESVQNTPINCRPTLFSKNPNMSARLLTSVGGSGYKLVDKCISPTLPPTPSHPNPTSTPPALNHDRILHWLHTVVNPLLQERLLLSLPTEGDLPQENRSDPVNISEREAASLLGSLRSRHEGLWRKVCSFHTISSERLLCVLCILMSID
mmetsp:Transcript_7124/g.13976  ORF Transcript_7124/g.13976 Transcript_7124/m.13976 type:complete len:270 (+) Transcript_7124:660-1469(+)